jgi:FkbM family methyltransferase
MRETVNRPAGASRWRGRISDRFAGIPMTKYGFALRHGTPSLLGFSRLMATRPLFAAELFGHRLHYFRKRGLRESFLTPEGCLVDTPDMLISYWCMFVERELADNRWTRPFTTAEKPLVVDVGANAGIFSLFAHSLNPTVELIAFEPLPAMQKRLADLKARSGMNLTVREEAASDSIGTARFESPHGYDGISRIASSQDASAPGTFQVRTTTLDTALAGRDIFLMKIDVEGFECAVLAGAREILQRTRFLIIEALTPRHVEDVTKAVGSGWERERLGAADLLFYR